MNSFRFGLSPSPHFRLVLLFCVGFLCLASWSFAEPGPGLPNTNYDRERVGDLISASTGYQEKTGAGTAPPGVICSDLGRTALVGWHRGYLFAGSEVPGSKSGSSYGQCVVDISNPASPKIVKRFENNNQGVDAHGYTKRGDEIHIGRRYRVDDKGLITSDVGYMFPETGGSDRGGALFAGWRAQFQWSYGTPADPFVLTEREAGKNKITHTSFNLMQDTGVVGHPFIIGNLMIYAADQSDGGVVAYDISDPKNPEILDILNAGIGIGSYWAEVWKHYLIMPRRRKSAGDPSKNTVHIVDFKDPSNLKYVAEVPVKGNPMYAQFQDNFAFIERSKIDLSPLESGGQPEVVLELDETGTGLDTSQFALPVGNLIVTGGIQGSGLWQGLGVWIHQAEPDSKGPSVAYHIPRNGEKSYPVTAPITILIHETIETSNLENGRTFIVRPVGSTQALDGDLLHSFDDFISFNPYGNFEPGVKYEVIFTEDALTDAVGKALVDQTGPGDNIAYRFTFTTDDGANPRPKISKFEANRTSPIKVGDTVSFSLAANDNNNLEYRFDFGDGTKSNRNRTAWKAAGTSISVNSLSHNYTNPGNYRVLVQVREQGSLTRLSGKVINLTVMPQLPSIMPSSSSQMALDETRRVLWVVNPDNDSLSRVNVDSNSLIGQTKVGTHPISVALDPNARPWVVSRDADKIYVVSTSGQVQKVINLDYGARPAAIAFRPGSNRGYISLEGNNSILEIDSQSASIVGKLPERNGVNFEFYDWFGSGFPVTSANQVLPSTFKRRFVGTWEGGLTEEVRKHFENEHARKILGNLSYVKNSFGFVYRGELEIPTSGSYTFHMAVQTEDGARLWINDNLVINNDSNGSGSRTKSGQVQLSAGRHPFVLRYYDFSGAENLLVEYEGPGISRREIPSSALFPDQEVRKPGTLAITADGKRLLVSQFISDDNAAKIASFDLVNRTWTPSINLFEDEKQKDSGGAARGVPNYLSGLSISPDGKMAWFGGKKDNIFAGKFRDKTSPGPETSVRAVIGPIDLVSNTEPLDEFLRSKRVDIDNHAFPSSITCDPTGTKILVSMQANNEIMAFDAATGRELDRVAVGLAPTAIAVDPLTRKIFVKNFLSRNLTVFDGKDLIDSGVRSLGANLIGTIRTVSTANEKMAPTVLRGKQLFYSAREIIPGKENENPSRMAFNSYLSCAVCHIDGGHDGRTWDFTNRGEGLRNTITLRGRNGMGQGNVHWSANFNEIQDFELDIVKHFGGTGFLASFGGPNDSMGASNAGLDPDLDALAAYVATLGAEQLPKSPYRSSSGSMTSDGNAGSIVFKEAGCDTCHNPNRQFTDSVLGTSPKLHNIGTLKQGSGKRLNVNLAGIDTPGLDGIHATAPYLHDGSAPTLRSVFEQFDANAANGSIKRAHDLGSLSQTKRDQLISYLLQLDGRKDPANDAPPQAPSNLKSE